MYCNVLVTKPFDHTFTYKIRDDQNIKLGNFSKEEQSITIYLVCDGLSKMSKDIMDMYKFGES